MKKLYAVKQNPEQFKNLMERELHEIITDEETNGYISIVKCTDTSIENLIRKARILSTRELDSEKYVVKKIYGETKAECAYIVCPASITYGEDGLNLLNYIEALYFKTAVPYVLATLDSEEVEKLPLDEKIKLVKQESIKTLLVPAKENAKYAIAVDQDTDLNDIVILN